MWLRKLSRDESRGWTAGAGAAWRWLRPSRMAGCSADYVENSEAPVLLLITEINDGAQLDSDVAATASSAPSSARTRSTSRVRCRTRTRTRPSAPSSAVQLEQLRGRATRAATAAASRASTCPTGSRGRWPPTVAVGDDVDRSRRGRAAAGEARAAARATSARLQIVTMFAQMTLSARPSPRSACRRRARFQIDFADFGDDSDGLPDAELGEVAMRNAISTVRGLRAAPGRVAALGLLLARPAASSTRPRQPDAHRSLRDQGFNIS